MDAAEDSRKSKSEHDAAAQTAPPARKPYLKPSFLHERAFETMALSCGKINTTQAQCKLNRKNS